MTRSRHLPVQQTHQVELAMKMYESGRPIAAIATHLDTSYNNVRQRLIKEGVQFRPRGGRFLGSGSAHRLDVQYVAEYTCR